MTLRRLYILRNNWALFAACSNQDANREVSVEDEEFRWNCFKNASDYYQKSKTIAEQFGDPVLLAEMLFQESDEHVKD